MIYTITFNPSLDYVVFVDQLNIGSIHRSDNYELIAGGKGINVSYVLKQLGCDSTALGFVAGHTGDCFEQLVNEYGITADFIKLKQGMTRINTKIRSQDSDKASYLETDINANGPVIEKNDIDVLLAKLDVLTKEDIVIVSGSVPKSIAPQIFYMVLKKCTQMGAIVVVDTSDMYLEAALESRPWLIKPNKEEIESFFKVKIDNREQIIDYGRKLQEKGAKNVLISLAGEGAILICEDGNILMEKAPKGNVINTVGAGDSMVAGFMVGYIRTESYITALKLGVCAGSATAFSTGLASKQEIEKLLGEI